MAENIPNLVIDAVDNGGVQLLRIEQTDTNGQSYVIDLHPLHIQRLAQMINIFESTHRGGAKEVSTLRRRMLLLRDRIDELDDILSKSGIERHADITELTTYSFATVQLANEFCMDIPGSVEEA